LQEKPLLKQQQQLVWDDQSITKAIKKNSGLIVAE
jgi:hypothetical protein